MNGPDGPALAAEVVIAGAGPGGAALASLLARAGHAVLLVDPEAPPPLRIGESLAPSAGAVLDALGLGDVLTGDVHLPSWGTLSSWGHDGLGVRDDLFQAHGHGWALDRAAFDAALRARAIAHGVRIRRDRITGAVATPTGVALRLRSGAALSAGFAVDATGRGATLARSLGAARHTIDDLTARYAAFSPDHPGDRDTRVLVEAVGDGWWYAARVPSGQRLVVRLSDEPTGGADAGRDFDAALAATRFVAATLIAFGYQRTGPLRGADARSAYLAPVAGPRWLALGDAALAVDPLSSQGIVDALLTARTAAATITGVLAGDRDAIPTYTAHVEALWRSYLARRHAAYSAEARWPTAPFWRARHQPGFGTPPGRAG